MNNSYDLQPVRPLIKILLRRRKKINTATLFIILKQVITRAMHQLTEISKYIFYIIFLLALNIIVVGLKAYGNTYDIFSYFM